MDLISVVVPVYNVSEYLCACIDSILCQTYQNLEIILVDDGSVDNCPQLCDEYALKDRRVKAIHQKNGGLSAARNKGYEVSSGRYIAFVDADDMVDSKYIEKLYRLLIKSNAQIAACAYTRTLKEMVPEANAKKYILTSKKMLQNWHGKLKAIETVSWNKLYDRQIFRKLETVQLFPEGRIHEDVYTSHLFVNCAETIAVTTEKLYYYRPRKHSISTTYTNEAVKADLDAQKERLQFFKQKKFYGAYVRLLVGHWGHKVVYGCKALLLDEMKIIVN